MKTLLFFSIFAMWAFLLGVSVWGVMRRGESLYLIFSYTHPFSCSFECVRCIKSFLCNAFCARRQNKPLGGGVSCFYFPSKGLLLISDITSEELIIVQWKV